VQFRRNAVRTLISTISEEKKHQSSTEMLQKLESVCPTKPYNDWVEHEHIEQDLSDGTQSRVTW
jgi:hypothetical protein